MKKKSLKNLENTSLINYLCQETSSSDIKSSSPRNFNDDDEFYSFQHVKLKSERKKIQSNFYIVVFPCLKTHHYIQFIVYISLLITSTLATCGLREEASWRSDGRCGPDYSLSTTLLAAQCDPKSERPCCSDFGYCGISPSHCTCKGCIDYRDRFQGRCIYSFNELSGHMESPHYPKPYPLDQDCCFDIKRPNEDYCGVSLNVEDLDLGPGEERGFCRRDWLSLPSCAPEEGTRICGNKTGQYFQYLFQPGSDSIRFHFHTGRINERKRGFRIKYEILKLCPGPYQTQDIPITSIPGTANTPCYTRINESRGTINSPFYPQPYPNNLECVYEFTRSDYRICGISMQSVKFILDEPMETPFGGACEDFMHLPSCGFLCGAVNFTWTVQFQPGATSLKFHFHSSDNQTSEPDPKFLINFKYLNKC